MSQGASMTPGDVNALFMRDVSSGRRKRGENVWRRGVYQRLVDCYGIDRGVLDVFDDPGKESDVAFHGSVYDVDELCNIYAVKTEVQLSDLLLRPLENPAFKALSELKGFDPFSDGGGVVFKVPYMGEWIMHTLGHPEGTLSGKAYIIVYAKRYEDRDIMVESLNQFIKTRTERK